MTLARPLALLALFVSTASAQQFQHSPGALPGPARWSEGVEAVDVDQDGDLDLLFADGDGFTSPGTQRQNVLLINNLIPSGTATFTDESVARLGANLSNGKGVTTGDVDGDGWVDLLYTSAFNTDTPFLYINQGPGSPGFFTMESAARGLTNTLSSGGAQFGDVDDDGDLDAVIAHAYLGSATGRPKLYINDGTGNFTSNAAAFGVSQKLAQMDVQLVDIDNDWDLDFFGVCRAGNGGEPHYLMLNDGTGTFSDASSLVSLSTGSNVYEAEVGDLDGDDDLDLFFVSLAGFREGASTNDLIGGGGSLGFTNQTLQTGNTDDNEIVLLDYDVDGDFDVVVGSLGGTEALYRNRGSFPFDVMSSEIQSIGDSTLDATAADIDNDGRYDLITAQGESNQNQWINKVYLNTGPVDDLAPVVTAIDSPATGDPVGPWKVRAKFRDQVIDDGVSYVTSTARYVINTAPNSTNVDINVGGFSPAVINVTAGASVIFTNTSGVNQDVTSTTSPYTYESGTLGALQSYEQIYVTPGSYDLTSTLTGLNAQVVVSGSNDSITGFKAGGGLHRFLMTDTAGGAGIDVVYELEFVDWPGNRRVTNNGKISLQDCTVSNYCTAGTSKSGCQALLTSSGTPSVSLSSGFTVSAANVEGNKDGLYFYGFNGQQANSWGSSSSYQCVIPPVKRAPLQSGTGTSNNCDGSFSQDLNAFWSTAAPAKVPSAGQEVSLQLWYRDPQNTSNQTTSLSDGVKFNVCP
jgi:plastocyanin